MLSRVEVFENGGSASLSGRAKTEVFKNGGSASLFGRAKTEVFKNNYVTGMSQLKKQNGCFLIRFRWSSVDGRKCCKKASVDEKLFIRFRKRISVDRPSDCTLTKQFSFSISIFQEIKTFYNTILYSKVLES